MSATARGIAEAEAMIWATIAQSQALDAAAARRGRAMELMDSLIARLGIGEAVARVPIIHIAGTKGKGSTAAMCESMLRSWGLRTGLFTSPHLVSVRERFRINGALIDEAVFLRHFWKVWDRLATGDESTTTTEAPGFFHLLTLVALAAFAEERVDVLVLEVGMGGRLDATNVIRHPVVCGVTTLDFDHVEVLGNTLPEIAREKAGIFKTGVPAISVPQRDDATEALLECARTVGASLRFAHPESMTPRLDGATLGLEGRFQETNAALAVALVEEFLIRTGRRTGAGDFLGRGPLDERLRTGLRTVRWPGRAQRLRATYDMPSTTTTTTTAAAASDVTSESSLPRVTMVEPSSGVASSLDVMLDGAHTEASMVACVEWFRVACELPRTASVSPLRVLVFGCGQDKDAVQLLLPLCTVPWDVVIITAVRSARPTKPTAFDEADALERYLERKRLQGDEDSLRDWAEGVADAEPTVEDMDGDGQAAEPLPWVEVLTRLWTRVCTDGRFRRARERLNRWGTLSHTDSDSAAGPPRVSQAVSAAEALSLAARVSAAEGGRSAQILVTGSLYLVGDALSSLGWRPE